MKKKNWLALLMAGAMLAGALTGCGKKEEDNADDGALKTVTEGKLTVAISPDFAPTVFVDPSREGQDQYVGTDVSLIRFIADELGLELVITPMSFDACQTAVSMGSVDFSVNGYAPTESRAENYLFSDPYRMSEGDGQTVICMASKLDQFTDLPNSTGLKGGVQSASLQENLMREQLPNIEVTYFSELNTGIMQLRNGDFDVMGVDGTNANAILAANPDIVSTGFYYEYETQGNVALIKKGNEALADAINGVLPNAQEHFADWLAEAKELADIGVEVILDDEGNVVTPTPAN